MFEGRHKVQIDRLALHRLHAVRAGLRGRLHQDRRAGDAMSDPPTTVRPAAWPKSSVLKVEPAARRVQRPHRRRRRAGRHHGFQGAGACWRKPKASRSSRAKCTAWPSAAAPCSAMCASGGRSGRRPSRRATSISWSRWNGPKACAGCRSSSPAPASSSATPSASCRPSPASTGVPARPCAIRARRRPKSSRMWRKATPSTPPHMAEQLGNERAANVVLLGALSTALEFSVGRLGAHGRAIRAEEDHRGQSGGFPPRSRWIEEARNVTSAVGSAGGEDAGACGRELQRAPRNQSGLVQELRHLREACVRSAVCA